MAADQEDPLTPKPKDEDDLGDLAGLHQTWKENLINEHLVFVNGVEMVEHEFKELLLELAIRLKDFVDAEPGKLRSLIKKFLQNLFLKRLQPYIKFNMAKMVEKDEGDLPTRKWPESKKDQDIRVIMVEKAKKEAEERKIKEEEDAKQAELDAEAEAERLAIEAQKAEEEKAK